MPNGTTGRWKQVLTGTTGPGGAGVFATPTPPPVAPQMVQTGTSGGQATEWTQQPLIPPVVDFLGMATARREAMRQAAQAMVDSIIKAAPLLASPGMEYFPGMEPGGLADTLLAAITGRTVAGAQALVPYATRAPARIPLPLSQMAALAAEPPLEAEFPAAARMAQAVLQAVIPFLAGQAASTQGGATWAPVTAAGTVDPTTQALIDYWNRFSSGTVPTGASGESSLEKWAVP